MAAMIMLGAATPAALNTYQRGIQKLVGRYPAAWPAIARADTLMRMEQWDTVQRAFRRQCSWAQLDVEHGIWSGVIKATAFGREERGPRDRWWEDELTFKLDREGLAHATPAPAPIAPSPVAAPATVAPVVVHQPAPLYVPTRPTPASAAPSNPGGAPVTGSCFKCGQVGHSWRLCPLGVSEAEAAQFKAMSKGVGRGKPGQPIRRLRAKGGAAGRGAAAKAPRYSPY